MKDPVAYSGEWFLVTLMVLVVSSDEWWPVDLNDVVECDGE